jgi:hypothetical protein
MYITGMKAGILGGILGKHVGDALVREYPFLEPVFDMAGMIFLYLVLPLILVFVLYGIFLRRKEIKEWFLFVLKNPKDVFTNFYRKHILGPVVLVTASFALVFFMAMFYWLAFI